jgi:hypothetical protein
LLQEFVQELISKSSVTEVNKDDKYMTLFTFLQIPAGIIN